MRECWDPRLKDILARHRAEALPEVAHAIPHSQAGVVKYRAVQRERLLNLLRTGADEASVAAFLTGWLIEFRDTPPELAESYLKRLLRNPELPAAFC